MTADVQETSGGIVRLEDVTKRFGVETLALDEVSLDVAPGEVVVLLGLSGSGKSTLLRHIDGLHQASSGTVRVLGTHVGQAGGGELRRLRRRIGFVFQQFHLVGSLTVLENVCTGALGRLRGPRLGLLSYPKKVRREALEHLDRVGLGAQALQRADTLSGGQQQRAAVARALMQRPEILLADEPVASLDPESAAQVMQLIRDISEERQLTVVCSLHQVDLALSWGDRVVGLRAGGVVLDMPVKTLERDEVMTVYSRVGADAGAILAGAG
ncbi:phosphonate ABC transporter ATP-binding protein [Streptomyces gobiensis]|uniref:phosphonate ABC transporter ATP-binding protein n=1 Tax=Streptomyces gobiensis TaxID=2875706 RepID=UPI001E4D3E70|nr:phosphonate ABC transporter ATP-binding protein [Streptomyces gobiensis]UGY91626.1 phosphonate ABC transporter ATP-binding protein [Streptomyces gobiensis]